MRSSVQDYSVESLDWLHQLHTAQPSRVGHTALELTRLVQADTPVLPSFVVSVASFQDFCRSIVWSSPFLSDFPHLSLRLRQEQPFQIQAVANEIYQGFQNTPLPSQWLQNSLTELQKLSDCWRIGLSLAIPKPWSESTPHLMRMLPVQYCQLPSIESGIKKAWASVFTAQTLLLMQELALPIDQIRIGLLLQPVDVAHASGFLAVTENYIHIQATDGLSKSLIMGDVLPDIYRFDRHTKGWQKDAGYITCSYQAPSPLQKQTLSIGDGLVSKVHNPDPDYPFILDQGRLEQLLALAHQMPTSDRLFPVVEWLFSADTLDPETLKVTSVWPELPFPMARLQPPLDPHHQGLTEANQHPSLMTQGLGAAIGQVIATVLVCQDRRQLQPQQVEQKIVVLDQVVPSDLIWLQEVAGLICTTGGYTSHGAIIARELGVPAIVGAESALEILKSGQRVVLDGTHGKVFTATQPLPEGTDAPPSAPEQSDPDLELQNTQVWINLSQPKLLQRALRLPVQGVGLLRSEWFLLDICQGQLPDVWLQQHSAEAFVKHLSQHLQSFLQAWHPRPVFYRSLDSKPDGLKAKGSSAHAPAHSMLGLRGVSHYMYDSTLFDLELQTLTHLHQQGWDNIRLILPFIRSVDEFMFCRQRLQAANLLDHLQVWIMAEVPSVLFQLPEYVAAGVQGITIGTNDLTQLLLGVDRDHAYLTQRYNANHPAVIKAISQLAQTAQALGIPCSICGQAPVHQPQLMEQLIEWGVTAISVDMAAVAETRVAIATAEQQLRAKSDTALNSSSIQNG